MPERYEIRIKGQLDSDWSNWFGGLTVTHIADDQTQLTGYLPDQSALHGLLEHIRDLNLKLISVYCGESSSDDNKRIQEGEHYDNI